jgi:hypothetical protein
MTLLELADWHRAMADSCSDKSVELMHRDAMEAIRWSVALPAVQPGEHSLSYALETLLDHTAKELEACTFMGLTIHFDDDPEAVEMERSLWRGLNKSIAEHMSAGF